MGDRYGCGEGEWIMRLIRTLMLVAFAGATGLVAAPGTSSCAWAGEGASGPDGLAARGTEFSAQQRVQENPPRQRSRTRVRITRPRPLGPNAYRECVAWYEQEYRPSGTVVVPKQRCWWVNP
jgi:hypothetical protein